MLKTSKSIAVSGGSDNINMIITDRDLYDANKTVVRKDLQDFQTKVWSAQDEVMAGSDEKACEG